MGKISQHQKPTCLAKCTAASFCQRSRYWFGCGRWPCSAAVWIVWRTELWRWRWHSLLIGGPCRQEHLNSIWKGHTLNKHTNGNWFQHYAVIRESDYSENVMNQHHLIMYILRVSNNCRKVEYHTTEAKQHICHREVHLFTSLVLHKTTADIRFSTKPNIAKTPHANILAESWSFVFGGSRWPSSNGTTKTTSEETELVLSEIPCSKSILNVERLSPMKRWKDVSISLVFDSIFL